MTDRPPMTDLAALRMRRRRAQPEAMFLHAHAADEIEDRLKLVNKTFTSVAVVTGFPDFWAERLPEATVITDTETLALKPAAYDLIVHAMSLHWSNDAVGQLIQCRRALKPDGLFICAMPGGQTLQELRACLGQAEVAVTGGLSPRIAPMAELRDVGNLLQRAGLALPVADTDSLHVSYRNAFHLMRDLQSMGEANALDGRLRKPTRRAVFDQANTLYHQHFATDDGRIPATFELIYLTGWAPSDTQQKPLRPGSAKQRLADALGTDETKLPN